MNKISYININTNILNNNIKYFKDNYNFKYYVFDVSNNAFNHGMYIINYLKDIDFLYVNNLKDLRLIRKYNKNIKVIYNGIINEDNIYDLIINNATVVIRDKKEIDFNIKEDIDIILLIDPKGFIGFNSREDIENILELIYSNKHIKLKGIMGFIKEEDYDNFKRIIRPLKNLEIVLLNNEEDKNKIKISNAIKLDYSLYGFGNNKKRWLKKEENNLKQVMTINTRVMKINTIYKKKKEIKYGIIPLGYLNGMNKNINKVLIKNKEYEVDKVLDVYSVIIINEEIKVNDLVIITNELNPIQNYINESIIGFLSIGSNNMEIVYDEEVNLIG